MMTERKLTCRVRKGILGGEYVVSVETVKDGGTRSIEFVADERSVEVKNIPQNGLVEGRVRVWSAGSANGQTRVVVPGSGGSDSQIVTVRDSVLT